MVVSNEILPRYGKRETLPEMEEMRGWFQREGWCGGGEGEGMAGGVPWREIVLRGEGKLRMKMGPRILGLN